MIGGYLTTLHIMLAIESSFKIGWKINPYQFEETEDTHFNGHDFESA
jgi:hypothetical protein